jgi:hypothetical protein
LTQQTFMARIVIDTKDKTHTPNEDEMRDAIYTMINHKFLDAQFPEQELAVMVIQK